jgi:hypothetical protein
MMSQTSVERLRNVSPKVLYPSNFINVPAIIPMTDINNIFLFFFSIDTFIGFIDSILV